MIITKSEEENNIHMKSEHTVTVSTGNIYVDTYTCMIVSFTRKLCYIAEDLQHIICDGISNMTFSTGFEEIKFHPIWMKYTELWRHMMPARMIGTCNKCNDFFADALVYINTVFLSIQF